jgi:hypothetical protein
MSPLLVLGETDAGTVGELIEFVPVSDVAVATGESLGERVEDSRFTTEG